MSRQPPKLAVWLYGKHLADIWESSRLRYRLEYTEQTMDDCGVGRSVLSLSLPISGRPTEGMAVGEGLDLFQRSRSRGYFRGHSNA